MLITVWFMMNLILIFDIILIKHRKLASKNKGNNVECKKSIIAKETKFLITTHFYLDSM